MISGKNIFIFLGFIILFNKTDGACTLPTELSGDWLDSRVDVTIRFQSLSVISGWTIQVNQETAVTFSCVESDESRWVFRSDQLIYYFGPDYYAIYCYEYTKLTDYSYSYYVLSDVETVTSSRVFMVSQSDEATFTSIDQYCPGRPDQREFHVLVKKGFQQNAHIQQYFPNSLLGVFSYTIDDGSGTTECSSGSLWDGCYVAGSIDRTTVSLNYSVCNVELMNATTGVLYNVANVSHSSTDYVMLMTMDGSITYFTCVAVTESGITRSVSTHPGRCLPNQVSTQRIDCDGCRLLSMTAYETCLFTTTSSTTTAVTPAAGSSSSGGSNTGAIVGVVISLLLLILIILAACVIYQKYFRQKKMSVEDPISMRPQSGLEIKKPLPDSDFSRSVLDLKREPTMSDDLVLDSLSPRDGAVTMERVMSRNSAPMNKRSLSREILVDNDTLVEAFHSNDYDIEGLTGTTGQMQEKPKAPPVFLFTRTPTAIISKMTRNPEQSNDVIKRNLEPLSVHPNFANDMSLEGESTFKRLPPISQWKPD